ncbi:MAG TPA: ABC transporter ATP-binding protein [Candidatus Pygmaiobacter gallistercoris]|nr:ABC transporter ATP-binding protein [Candidatus Pygmaiobacter gallistercoris]
MVLRCENICKEYGGKRVLEEVTLQLEQGHIYGLIGRNGAGKTTLLSILTAQNPATSGTVTLNGAPVWENQSALDHLCFSREINPANTFGSAAYKVREYLRIARAYYPNWDEAYAKRLIDAFGLDVKKRIGKLSKGMLSMVTIVVALASRAEITILDEPVAGLDVVAREKFYQLLLEDQTETGRAFVISTHIIEEAASLFEKVIILQEGRLRLMEDTDELVSRFWAVSGRADEVDAACAGLTVYHTDRMGRAKTVYVSTEPGRQIRDQLAGRAVDVAPLSLQQLFVAVCGDPSMEVSGR